MNDKLIVFESKKIRRVLHNSEWYYVIVDVICALTDSRDPKGYLKDMRRRDAYVNEGWGQIATPLKIETEGGPQIINCANKKRLFRLIQSIPSRKAEPFKLWLAKVGSEGIDEMENSELAQEIYVEGKDYELGNVCDITSSDTRSIFPGDLRVARCFSFNFSGGKNE